MVDRKKLGLCFLFAIIVVGAIAAYLEFGPNRAPKPEQIVMWSSDEDYCFAVDASFDGDTFKPGRYHFYDDNVITSGGGRAWEIFASKEPLLSRADLTDDKSVAIVGGPEELDYTVDISSGNYIYVKYRGQDEGSLIVDWTPTE